MTCTSRLSGPVPEARPLISTARGSGKRRHSTSGRSRRSPRSLTPSTSPSTRRWKQPGARFSRATPISCLRHTRPKSRVPTAAALPCRSRSRPPAGAHRAPTWRGRRDRRTVRVGTAVERRHTWPRQSRTSPAGTRMPRSRRDHHSAASSAAPSRLFTELGGEIEQLPFGMGCRHL